LLNSLSELRRRQTRLDRDRIDHTPNAGQSADDSFGIFLLILPLNFTFEGDPSLRHRDIDLLDGDDGI
jgi:hypothetical protein